MIDCIYPDAEWGDEFLQHLNAPMPHLPADWRSRVVLPDPATIDVDQECKTLATIILERPKHQGEIIAQAQLRAAAISPVLAVLDPFKPPVKTRTIALIEAALDEVLGPTFLLKREYRRGRPRHCCAQALDPMFRFTDLDPLHPAYPSGHATQAHTAAAVMALLHSPATAALHAAADGVARNREIAGLHFPSDSAAGAMLAEQLVRMLAEPGVFKDQYITPALSDW
jgi:hypothetical protein